MTNKELKGNTFIVVDKCITASCFQFVENMYQQIEEKRGKLSDILKKEGLNVKKIIQGKKSFFGEIEGFILENPYQENGFLKPLKGLGIKGCKIDTKTEKGKSLNQKILELGNVRKQDLTDYLKTDNVYDVWINKIDESTYIINFRDTVTIRIDDESITAQSKSYVEIGSKFDKVKNVLTSLNEVEKIEIFMRIEMAQQFQKLSSLIGIDATINEFNFDNEQFTSAINGTMDYTLRVKSKLEFLLRKY